MSKASFIIFSLILACGCFRGFAQVNERSRLGVGLGYGMHAQWDNTSPYTLAGAYKFGIVWMGKSSSVFQTTLHLQSITERFKSEVNEDVFVKQFYSGVRLQIDVRLRMNQKNRFVVGIAPLLLGKPNAQIEVRNSALTTSNSFSSSINAEQFNPEYNKWNAAMVGGWSYRYKDIVADLLLSYDALPILKTPIEWRQRIEGFPISETYNFNPRPFRMELSLSFLIRTKKNKASSE